jgi:hypothetical protein
MIWPLLSAHALFEAGELIRTMNTILSEVTTSQGIGVRLEWRTRGDLDPATSIALRLLAKDPDARTEAKTPRCVPQSPSWWRRLGGPRRMPLTGTSSLRCWTTAAGTS